MSNDELELASDFKPISGEANFGPPLTKEVKGGTHIAPEIICTQKGKFVMAVWPQGLPRHDKSPSVRFPHGLIMYGETFEECTTRLVKEQFGLSVITMKTLKIYSYMDASSHWHIEPLLHAEVDGDGVPPLGVSKLLRFWDRSLPEGTVWTPGEFEKVFDHFFSESFK